MSSTAHSNNLAAPLLKAIWLAAQGDEHLLSRVAFKGAGELPSVFAVTDLAAAAMGAAGLALSSLADAIDSGIKTVTVDRRLASFWFAHSLRPIGWKPPSAEDFVMGDYQTSDGWIRLHTNAPHHRAAALRALNLTAPAERTDISQAVATWTADTLEARVLNEGGCAATMRSWQDWQAHPQGQAVLTEPLLHWQTGAQIEKPIWAFNRNRPLQGLKVLDMTRVLAGPSATRMLAGLGAEVLRIDPPWWDEPTLAPEMTLGKRCTRLDLRNAADRERWIYLLSEADILVHGYRSDALSALGLDATQRQKIRPGLVDISLDAYGFTGPWQHRRGFDSLVQMSMGIAHAGQQLAGSTQPKPLPVQALDHATGYILATAALRGLEGRLRTGAGSIARGSLARTGALLMTTLSHTEKSNQALAPETMADQTPTVEDTYWGAARRLNWPLEVSGITMRWDQPAAPLGSSPATWKQSHD
jgi:crotonobetainyl-CoA:carnitine CoA-transferase CaiB-like acyl-CoA transferase